MRISDWSSDVCSSDLQAILSRWNRVDVLANIAGGFAMGDRVHEASDETWQLMFDLNVRTMLNMSRAVVPAMLKAGSGRIINVGATGALRGGALIDRKSTRLNSSH